MVLQMQKGSEHLSRARREVRQAVVRAAEVVACTLSGAGGDLLALSKGSVGFQALIIDEVGPTEATLLRQSIGQASINLG